MFNVDIQKIYGSIKYHNTEKYVQPVRIDRGETQDNSEGDAKNRQQSSYNEVLNILTEKISNCRQEQSFAYTV